MPMIDCAVCYGLRVIRVDGRIEPCGFCDGTGRVPDDFFPEDSEELRDPDEEPELIDPKGAK